MPGSKSSVAFLLAGVLIGIVIASTPRLSAQAPGPPSVEVPRAMETYFATKPIYRGLDANLFVQTSAEYRACCYQAYNLAKAVLAERIRDRAPGGKPPAVVLDLDETVFDNSGFQAMLVRSGLTFDIRLWRTWQNSVKGRLVTVPGAVDFIQAARAAGVEVFYVGNTKEEHRATVKQSLQDFGIPAADDDHLRLRADGEPNPDDKTSRRKWIADRFDILVIVGDNLRDFDETFAFSSPITPKDSPQKATGLIRERKDKVDARRNFFGSLYIMLPNPTYGEWMRPMVFGEHDEDMLAETRK
ncbi:5'-nucleotidase, lipoprotein e(P4) family [Aquisphaera insulae]|uniref:5'-nucleotidase, lipoprotein e(P4) family n=1 Tax=Aquisphaera insulae TaxID=2712864 RepID=UPI0013EE3ECF|nr:HAD family acid phosphatase [Aquisphaera insulae]